MCTLRGQIYRTRYQRYLDLRLGRSEEEVRTESEVPREVEFRNSQTKRDVKSTGPLYRV